jgi:hypothetical protein
LEKKLAYEVFINSAVSLKKIWIRVAGTSEVFLLKNVITFNFIIQEFTLYLNIRLVFIGV